MTQGSWELRGNLVPVLLISMCRSLKSTQDGGGCEFNASLNPSPNRSLLQPFLVSSCNCPCYVAAQKTAAKDIIIAGVFFGRAKAAFLCS